MDSTIYALASGAGRAGIAIIRVSGPHAGSIAQALAGPLPAPRQACLRRLVYQDRDIDQGLLVWFPGPASFTGQDTAEFHVHGGRAIRECLFSALSALGARPAEPGEFSRRAVENGKLDLTQAEAIADLVGAETSAQLRQALRQYDGALAELYEGWRRHLISALGRVEAAIDFSDDGVSEEEIRTAKAQAATIIQQIQEHTNDSGRGESLREGLRLTILGPPNAGKSTLINMLARRDVAIVSDIAGTTRDVLEVRLDLGGYLLQVADTAGVRQTTDVIEAEGVRRALSHAAGGMTLLVLDGSLADPRQGLPPDLPEPDLTVWNKSDLGVRHEGISISLKTGEGFGELIELLRQKVEERLESQDGAPALTRPRHRHALTEALDHLQHGQSAPIDQPELLAEDLRLAMRAIGRITGHVDVEELLDVVFRDFCIGK